MRQNVIATVAITFFLIGCACNAGSVKTQRPNDVVNGEYLVVIDSTMIKMDEAKQKIIDEFKKNKVECKTKRLSSSVVHLIFDKETDFGLDKVKKDLSTLKWVKSVEPNRIVKISKSPF